jgi:2-polyprenyl-6-methoxyphenol hydroxylase-like FAD-dependent oxidoreductase
MPPTRGIGGNTALRDASLLCQQLVAAYNGEKPLLRAIHDYEAEMLKYGFKAVRDSTQAMNMIVAEKRFFYNAILSWRRHLPRSPEAAVEVMAMSTQPTLYLGQPE